MQEVALIGDIPIMPHSPHSSGRLRRRSSRADDESTPRKANPAAIVAVAAVVVGTGLLIWVMSGGLMRRTVPTPVPVAAEPARGASAIPTAPNRPPRADLRVRIDPRYPTRLEYGAFADAPDPAHEGRLTFSWSFGDDTPVSTTQRGVHVYSQSGTFQVRLIVRDPVGAEVQVEQTVTIAPVEHTVGSHPPGTELPGLRLTRITLPLSMEVDFAALEPLWAEGESLIAPRIDNTLAPRGEFYALRFSGFIVIPRDGLWTFSLTSDDGSRLILDGQRLIDMNQHQPATTEWVTVQAAAGLVPIQVDYFQTQYDHALYLEWEGPGQQRSPVPDSALVHHAP